MRAVRLAIVSTLFVATVSLAQADWRFDAETGSVYDSNLSNSDRSTDEKDDWAWKTDVRAGNGFQLSRDLRLSLVGDLHGEVWDRFDAFNKIGGGALAALRYRFGLGRMAPWVSLENGTSYDRFKETERSGWDESCRLVGGMAVSDRIALEAGYSFANFAAADDFWDEQSHHANVRAIVDLISALQVAVG